jgi:hypothetical protein
MAFNARSLLGAALLGQKKLAEAEPLLASGYEGMKQQEAQVRSRRYLREPLTRLVQLYTDWGKPDKAAEWKAKLDEFNRAEAEKQSAPPPK